ncbi:MAG: MBL fold metallo-hydrolase, partial [Pseudomonadota bacterium]
DVCKTPDRLQVLGSGGPELQDKRASSSYLIWIDNKPRVLVDIGGGSALRFGQAEANLSDLAAVLFTHLHVDHVVDFAALITSSYFEQRRVPLPVLGPRGNHLMPDTESFVNRLFDENTGAYPYLNNYLTASKNDYWLVTQNIDKETPSSAIQGDIIDVSAVNVHHGPIPAVAWRIDHDSWSVAFTGDMSERGVEKMSQLAEEVDIMVAHNAVPEGANRAALNLHMPPSVIGRLAKDAQVRRLVLSHRMRRTLGKETETLNQIRESYKGPVDFADDLDCFPL